MTALPEFVPEPTHEGRPYRLLINDDATLLRLRLKEAAVLTFGPGQTTTPQPGDIACVVFKKGHIRTHCVGRLSNPQPFTKKAKKGPKTTPFIYWIGGTLRSFPLGAVERIDCQLGVQQAPDLASLECVAAAEQTEASSEKETMSGSELLERVSVTVLAKCSRHLGAADWDTDEARYMHARLVHACDCLRKATLLGNALAVEGWCNYLECVMQSQEHIGRLLVLANIAEETQRARSKGASEKNRDSNKLPTREELLAEIAQHVAKGDSEKAARLKVRDAHDYVTPQAFGQRLKN